MKKRITASPLRMTLFYRGISSANSWIRAMSALAFSRLPVLVPIAVNEEPPARGHPTVFQTAAGYQRGQ
jgi:hypothetical protein